MKQPLSILFTFLFLSADAQKDVASLAQSLVQDCAGSRQKVTAIFRWITDHIAYTTFTKQSRQRNIIISEPDDDGPLKPLNERVAEMVYKRRTSFCDGYARLFTTLCDYAGIRSVIICGYANGGAGSGKPKFGVNHYWNAVWLDGKWELLDATWASGYIDMQTGEFTRNYDDRYFLSSPEVFIRDHYPDDPRWTLLPDNKIPDEFRSSPFRQKSFAKYGFTSFYPGRGIIEAAVGDTIVLHLEAGQQTAGVISPSLTIDSTIFTHSSSWVFLQPDEQSGQKKNSLKQQYTYPVTKADVQWLYLVFNDDVVMRYKINVRDRQYN